MTRPRFAAVTAVCISGIALSLFLWSQPGQLIAALLVAFFATLWMLRSESAGAYAMRLTPDALTVTRPRRADVVLDRGSIRQLTIRLWVIKQGRSVYTLHAIDQYDRLIPLVDDLRALDEATFIEVFLESQLGIADVPVPGEVAKHSLGG